MAIRRYKAEADNTISNAFKENLSTRATGSNMGQADVSEVFSTIRPASGLCVSKILHILFRQFSFTMEKAREKAFILIKKAKDKKDLVKIVRDTK